MLSIEDLALQGCRVLRGRILAGCKWDVKIGNKFRRSCASPRSKSSKPPLSSNFTTFRPISKWTTVWMNSKKLWQRRRKQEKGPRSIAVGKRMCASTDIVTNQAINLEMITKAAGNETITGTSDLGTRRVTKKRTIEEPISMQRPPIPTKISQFQMTRYLTQRRPRSRAIHG